MNVPFTDLFCLRNKFLLSNFLSRNLKLKYRRSLFGYLWTMLVPMAQVAIFFFVYRVVLHIEIPNYLSFILSGLLPWTFFVTSLNECLESLVGGQHLLVHAPVPIQIFPATATFTNFVNYVVSLPLLVVVTFLEVGALPTWSWLWVLPLSALLCIFTYALGFLLACLYVYLRDLKHLISIVVQLWLYLTPVLYRADMVPARYAWILWVNPLAGYFVFLRQALFDPAHADFSSLGIFLGWTVVLVLAADFVRARYGRRLVEKL